ncbi:hypothetical protein AURDEDRAFT_109963 [Auricularia subglabra TFB-10046 SS5]|nr:hypothetical protein AURDEDRAFT_109963 [Auricularia subglabra TFB-10046 SS5]
MSTRPILRNAGSSLSSVSSSSSSSAAASSRRVHFPPPTALASIHPALPASAYDRSCIVVSVNPCALPPRGARYYAAVDPPPKQSRQPQPQTPYRPRSNPFDELQADDAEASTTDESDATPTPAPAAAPAPSSKPKRASNTSSNSYTRFAPSASFSDMACLQGF